MACRGCVNLQCNCFTTNSSTAMTVGNGSPYAPFTFRPEAVPFPRPFGHLYGAADQNLDGASYTQFGAITPDIDQGGNMRTGNNTTLTATADGLHLVGIFVPFAGQNLDLIDNFSIRKNASPVSTVTFSHNTTVINTQLLLHSTTTLVDMNVGDVLDLFVERVVGAGTVFLDVTVTGSSVGFAPQLWAVWVGGPI